MKKDVKPESDSDKIERKLKAALVKAALDGILSREDVIIIIQTQRLKEV